MPHFLDLQLAVGKGPVMSAMLPPWIADFIAEGTERRGAREGRTRADGLPAGQVHRAPERWSVRHPV